MREEDYLEEITGELAEKYREGREKLDRGNFEEAQILLEEVKAAEPSFPPVYNKLAVLALYREEYQKARQLLDQALKIDQEFAPALTNMGSIARENGDRERAKEYYHQAIELDPEYGPAYNNLGVVLREEGQYRESIKHLKKANKLKSYSVEFKDRPVYKEPGCLIPVAIVALVLLVLYFFT